MMIISSLVTIFLIYIYVFISFNFFILLIPVTSIILISVGYWITGLSLIAIISIMENKK